MCSRTPLSKGKDRAVKPLLLWFQNGQISPLLLKMTKIERTPRCSSKSSTYLLYIAINWYQLNVRKQ